MIEWFYLLSFIFVIFILKAHPTSMIFVFLVNFLNGFTSFITTFVTYDLVFFEQKLVFFLLLAFNLSISTFHLAYRFIKRNEAVYVNFARYKYSHLIFTFLLIPTLFVVVQNITQGMEVITYGYIAGYKAASEQTLKATSFFPFLLIFNFLVAVLYLREKKIIYLLVMMLVVFSYMVYGSRSFFLYTFISIISFLILLKRITYKKCIVISLLLLPIVIVVGAFREGGVGNDTTLLYRMAMELANIPMIISNLNVLDNLNQPILYVFLTTLPQSIIVPLGVTPLNSLATEFAVNYDPGWAEAGGGFGFTIIGEIYYRFGYFGLIVIPYCIVMFIHHLENKFLKGDDFDKALILTMYYGLLMWVRGDFIEISRLVLIVLFFYYAKRLVYRNGK
ncbi:O-antigen polymerase [Aeromonas jandaei]|uniref:O-antigen polymerase n=1 Tax=Aeromonas jandaei TaxID=650 RepID=UPI00191E26EF|nr:O-antigen polymerase [Aeromonas jandaei]MBL0625546.1 oligosaccharide repeat unit polymerase [Aeromonas jandaei]